MSDIVLELPQTPRAQFSASPEDIDTEHLVDSIVSSTGVTVAKQLFSSSTASVRSFASSYTIDSLRPHFDIEPKMILRRALASFQFYEKPSDLLDQPDLYTPLMTILTFIVLVYFGLQGSKASSPIGITFLSRSITLAFSYWIVVSLATWFTAYTLGTSFTLIYSFALIGYSMISYCIVLLLSFVFSGSVFTFLGFICFAASGATLVSSLYHVSTHKNSGLIFGAVEMLIHVCFGIFVIKYVS
ncbi:hypothetical protein RCL1_008298 [Eukaryota sp. TZLM3-RCL]